MNIYSKNTELLQCFKEYESKFERMNESLNYKITTLDQKSSKKTENKNYHFFRIWLEKSREKIEIDYYKKKIQSRHYINDPSSYDDSIKSFNYFSNEWPVNFSGIFFLSFKYKISFYFRGLFDERRTNHECRLTSFVCINVLSI